MSGNVFAGGKGMTYDAQKFQDARAVAKELVAGKLDTLKKFNVKKVVIAECFGEFMESKEKADGFNGFAWQGGTAFKTTTKLGGDYYETIANAVYDSVAEAFKANGIEVADKNTVVADENYKALELKEEGKGGGFKKGGLTSRNTVTKTVKRSTTDMGLISDIMNPFKMAKLKKLLPQIAKNNNAEAVLKIKFFVDQGKNFAPVLSSLDIAMDCNINEANAGRGKVDYYFKNENVGLLGMKTALLIDADVKVKKGPFDADLYHNSLMTLIDSVIGVYKSALQAALAQ
jgi:hypothetical protein